MTSGVPWNVKGIRPEARLTAKEAARRSGLSVGEWLNSAIIESAIEEGVRPRPHGQVYDENFDGAEEELHRRRAGEDDDAMLATLNGRLDGLSRQIERVGRAHAEAMRTAAEPPATSRIGKDEENSQRLAHLIDRLDRRLDQLIAQTEPERERRVSAVDRAAAALGASEERASEFDQAVAEITRRQRALDAESDAPVGLRRDTIGDLRADLADIRRTLTEAMPRHALAALESEIRTLANRLLESRQAGGDHAALASLEDRIAEVRDAVRALAPAESLIGVDNAVQSLARKIELIAASDQDPATLYQLEEATAALRAMTSQVASNDALAEFAQQVRGLSAKIDNLAGGADVLATLDERISMLADALQRHNGTMVPPQFDAVLKSVNDKLERLQLKGSDNTGFGALEDRIGQLLERFDANRHVNRSAEPGIDALKDDIAGLKQTQSESERRIQDSLEALNITLGHVADRLSLIETDLRAKSPQTNVLRTAESTPRATAPERRPAPAYAPSQPAAMPKLPPPPPKCEPIDPNLPPDHPLEPGSRGRVALSAADRIAGSETAKPPIIPDSGGKSNFIAAARRAAQAAAAETAPRTSARVASNSAETMPDQGRGKRVRSLLVAISIVLIVLGTLHLGVNLLGLFDSPSPQAKMPANVRVPAIETKPVARSDTPVAPVANRQSGLVPGGNPMNLPAAGLLLPDASVPRPAAASKPEFTGSVPSIAIPAEASAPRQPAAPKPEFTGAVQLPVVPAATPEYAALPESPVLPAAIGGRGLRTAATNGDPAAAYEIATRYAEGRGVAQNYEEAARWLDRAVKERLAPAQFRLGSLYEKGLGVKKDLQMARQLYTAAGEKGNAKAMHNLAVLYAEGIDGKPDYHTAADWFRKAAERGIRDSQYNLGILYARGIGVEQNLPESYKWFALAAAAGDNESAKKRDDVGGRLDAESLMAARLAAQTWTARPQPEEATNVKTPPGGWEQASGRPSKSKPAARPRVGSAAGSP